MAKFIYKMENILKLQIKLEDEAKIQLTLANNVLRTEEERLEKIYMDISGYENMIRAFSNDRLDVLELKRCNDAIAIKKMEAEEQKKRIAAAKKDVDKAMTKVNQAMIERKTQETLKEKAFEVFMHELNEEEKKEVDQIVSYQYNGNMEEGES